MQVLQETVPSAFNAVEFLALCQPQNTGIEGAEICITHRPEQWKIKAVRQVTELGPTAPSCQGDRAPPTSLTGGAPSRTASSVGPQPSAIVNRLGNCHDIAMAESFFPLFKRKRTRNCPALLGIWRAIKPSLASKCSTTCDVVKTRPTAHALSRMWSIPYRRGVSTEAGAIQPSCGDIH